MRVRRSRTVSQAVTTSPIKGLSESAIRRRHIDGHNASAKSSVVAQKVASAMISMAFLVFSLASPALFISRMGLLVARPSSDWRRRSSRCKLMKCVPNRTSEP